VSTQELSVPELRPRDRYRLLTDLVAPRPIAWISTMSSQGLTNLAPFSYFQAVSSDPATIVLGFAWRGDGRPKDTLANILETHELTINHVSRPLTEAMNATSGDYAPGVSEWEACAIESSPAQAVRPARVAGAIAGLECRLTHAIPLGQSKAGSPSSTLVIAEVVHIWIRSGLLQRDERGHLLAIEPGALGAVARLGGNEYSSTEDHWELLRPKLPE
jgi:flavin reductase (DIM6/NTAB) family NADH-FMN oxidoreductase RutF